MCHIEAQRQPLNQERSAARAANPETREASRHPRIRAAQRTTRRLNVRRGSLTLSYVRAGNLARYKALQLIQHYSRYKIQHATARRYSLPQRPPSGARLRVTARSRPVRGARTDGEAGSADPARSGPPYAVRPAPAPERRGAPHRTKNLRPSSGSTNFPSAACIYCRRPAQQLS